MKGTLRKSRANESTQILNFLYSLIGGAPYGVLAFDLEGMVTVANTKALTHLGIGGKVGHAVDKSVASLLDAVPDLREMLGATCSGADFDIECETRDGRTLSIRRRAILRGGLLTIDDISEKVEADRAMARNAEFLSERNRELEELAFMAAHDLKSPMVSITGMLELLKTDERLAPECRKMAQMASATASRMGQTIKGLGEIIAMRQSLGDERETVDVSEVCEEVETMLAGDIADSSARISNQLADCPAVQLSRAHVGSVLQNLVSNAIRYRSPERDPEIRISGEIRDAELHLHVEDNGLGMDLERSGHKLFKLFETLHNHPDSQGLGLHLVDSIVRSYGGRMEVASEVGKGTRMTAVFGGCA